MHTYNFLCSDSLLYTSFFFFLLYMVFIHVIVHVCIGLYNYNDQLIKLHFSDVCTIIMIITKALDQAS